MDQYPPPIPPDGPPQGYPQQPGAYPPAGSSFPTQPGYSQQPGAYPPAPGQAGYPQQPGAYPPADSSFPGQPAYPQQQQPGVYQPGIPGQPGYMPSPPPRRSGKLWAIILAVVVVLVLLGSVGYFVVLPRIQQASPNATLQTFCDGYKTLNAQEVYGTFSTSLQAKPSGKESSLESAFALLKDVNVKIDDCSVVSVQQNGSNATATVKITSTTLGTTQTTSNTINLVLENGVWKVDSIGNASASI